MDLGDDQRGAYLTDQERLYQIVRAYPEEGLVLLEDSGDPSRPLLQKKILDLKRDGFRVVKPAFSR